MAHLQDSQRSSLILKVLHNSGFQDPEGSFIIFQMFISWHNLLPRFSEHLQSFCHFVKAPDILIEALHIIFGSFRFSAIALAKTQ